MVAQGEVALAAGPDGHRAVGAPLRRGRVRFDVALVHRAGVKLPLHDDIRLGEPGVGVAQPELEAVGYVAWLAFRVAPSALPQVGVGQRDQPVVQKGGVLAHGVVGVQHWRQHFVVNVQGRQGFFRCSCRRCRNRGDGVADVQGLLPCHHVATVKSVVDRRPFFLVGYLGGDLREVG